MKSWECHAAQLGWLVKLKLLTAIKHGRLKQAATGTHYKEKKPSKVYLLLLEKRSGSDPV